MEVQKEIPKKGDKFYNTTSVGGYSKCIKGKPTQDGLNVLCNCVGYACGRFNSIIGNMKYPNFNCNAENFIERAKTYKLEISQIPVVGGICVFQKGKTLKGDDGAGHVLIIEVDHGDGDTYDISESGYNSYAFRYRTTKKSDNFGLNDKYKYLGCIVNPAVNTKPVEPPKPSDEKIYYKIQKGDTLTKIAKKYKTSVSAIMKLNPQIKDKNKIFAGDTIRVK